MTSHAFLTEHAVKIPLRDGIVLDAVVMRQAAADAPPAPVLLMRSPYPLADLQGEIDSWGVLRRGLVLVQVSARGTGASQGDFEPWVDEQSDGLDTIAWCVAQPWCDGNVVTGGRSYLAQSQLYAAGGRPPALRAMALGVCPSDPYDLTYPSGAFAAGSALGWALAQGGGRTARAVEAGDADPSASERWREAMRTFEDLLAAPGPLESDALDLGTPTWRDCVAHTARDAWWAARAVPERDPVPTFFVGGWHDVFIRGTLREFDRSPHPASRLVVGPWAHGPGQASLGEVFHGFEASAGAAGVDAEMLDFLAAHATGRPVTDAEAPVRLFVMGTGSWFRTSAWPPPGSTDRTLFLHADGRLAGDAPGDAPVDADGRSTHAGDDAPTTVSFVHDPAHPVPSIGGATLFLRGEAACGAGSWDQRPKDARPDVVSFVSDPLTDDVDVVGVVRLSLLASTTALDADWCATLVDVHPDGRALGVVDGVVRARLATTDTAEHLLAPGVPHRFEIEVGPTAQRFAAGHRIRLDVAGSNHPRIDVNPGTGGTWAATPAEEYVVARQTLHLGAGEGSFLALPVVDTRL